MPRIRKIGIAPVPRDAVDCATASILSTTVAELPGVNHRHIEAGATQLFLCLSVFGDGVLRDKQPTWADLQEIAINPLNIIRGLERCAIGHVDERDGVEPQTEGMIE